MVSRADVIDVGLLVWQSRRDDLAAARSPLAFALGFNFSLMLISSQGPYLMLHWLGLTFGYVYASWTRRPLWAIIAIGVILVSTAAAIPGTMIWGDGGLENNIVMLGLMAPLAGLFFVQDVYRILAWLVPFYLLHSLIVIYEGAVHQVYRTAGVASNPNAMAGFLALGAIYMIHHPRLRWLAPLPITAIAFTGSRWASVVLILVLAAMLIKTRLSLRQMTVAGLVLVILVVPSWRLIAANFRLMEQGEGQQLSATAEITRHIGVALAKRQQTDGRVASLLPSGSTFANTGLHNVPARIASDTGLLAAAAWVILTGAAIWRRRWTSEGWLILTIGLLAMMDTYVWLTQLAPLWWVLVAGVANRQQAIDAIDGPAPKPRRRRTRM